jgi:uncharacterized protein
MNAAGPSFTEEPFFFDVGADRLFAFVHMPRPALKGCLVFCHAFAEEKLWSHRVYVTFAREAATAGYAVLRFDMRGEGDSSRDFEETTVETRIEDTLNAIELARERFAEGLPLVLVGHRFGGTIAAVAASRATASVQGIVVWDPIADGADYVGQLLRSNMATQMATEGKVTRTRDSLIRAILDGEVVTVDGYGLTASMYQGISALRWAALPNFLVQPALVLEVQKGEQMTPSRAFAELRGSRPTLEVRLVQEPPFWRETRQFHKRAAQFTKATIEWLNGLQS